MQIASDVVSRDLEEIQSTNAKTKDSVFYSLFNIKENVLQLYKDLYPEDTEATIDDVQVKTLTSIFINYLYNDLGFIVKRNGTPHFIILIEAQSRWNNNITMRIFLYLASTYHRYMKETKQSMHLSAKIDVPAPELYLVYTGTDLKNVPDEINIRDDLFGGEGSVDIKVKVIHAPSDTIIGQYIAFCKIYNEQYQLYGKDIKTIEETIRICLERRILVKFLTEHRQEVVTMLMTLFDEQAQREEYDESLKKKSREEGREEGIEIGETKTLIELVKEGLLSLSAAAKRKNMTEAEFAALPGMKKA